MTGYDSKRKMAADKFIAVEERKVGERYGYVPKLHPSEWMNAQPAQEPINLLEARKIAAEYGTPDSQIDSGNLYFALSKCLEHIDAQPAQEPVALDVTIEGDAVKLLADMLEPVLDEPTPIRLLIGDGHSGHGLYVAASEYQNEGAVLLVNTTPPLPVQPVQEPVKLWLWKNFVDGKSEYWAFDNPFPIFMDSHDPQTLGEPCGYALLKPSRAGRTDVSDEQVLQDVQKALAQPAQEPVAFESFLESQDFYELMQTYRHCLTDALLPFEEVKDALRAAHIGSKP